MYSGSARSKKEEIRFTSGEIGKAENNITKV